EIARRLIAAGRSGSTPVAAIQWATWPAQRTVRATLATAADRFRGLTPPTVMIAGTVAGMASRELRTESTGPLAGVRIAVTRAGEEREGLSMRLERLGAAVVPTPVIRMAAVAAGRAADAAFSRLEAFDWILFTSAHAV